jgi:hypothetical protein
MPDFQPTEDDAHRQIDDGGRKGHGSAPSCSLSESCASRQPDSNEFRRLCGLTLG